MRITAFPRALERPREMPELRAALITSASDDGIWARAEFERLMTEIVGDPAMFETTKEGHRVIMGPKGYNPDDLAAHIDRALQSSRNNIRWYREHLPEAQLIHVAPHMCEFIRQAADSVPPSLTIHRDDAPSPAGLVVFATPMMGHDAGPIAVGSEVRVDGIFWAPVRLPGRDVPWFMDTPDEEHKIEGISIASFHLLEPEGVVPQMWVGLGRTDWPWGDRVDDTLKGAIPDWSEVKQASLEEDRRLLAAIWATINQKLLVETEIVFPDRHTAKRLIRAGMGDNDNRVTVVHLRKTEYRALGTEEGTGEKLKWRTPVRKHFKRQPYGPGRKLRKIIVIMPYWRGPEDAPIRHTERIWEIDR